MILLFDGEEDFKTIFFLLFEIPTKRGSKQTSKRQCHPLPGSNGSSRKIFIFHAETRMLTMTDKPS